MERRPAARRPRRSQPRPRRSARPGAAGALARHPLGHRARARRRVVLRQPSHRAGLEAVVLQDRIGPALGADRRACLARPSATRPAGVGRCDPLQAGVAGCRRLGEGQARPCDRRRRHGAAGRRHLAHARPPRRPHEHGERQLLRRDAPEATRSQRAPARDDGCRRKRRASRPRRTRRAACRRAHRRRLRAVAARPSHCPRAGRAAALGMERPVGRAAVQGVAAHRGRQRHARGPHAHRARARRRESEDGHHEPRLGAGRLRRRGLRVRPADERQPRPVLLRESRAGPLRPAPGAHASASPKQPKAGFGRRAARRAAVTP